MFLEENKIKNAVIVIVIITVFLFLYIENVIAASASIRGVSKIYRNSRYIISINYETHDKRTDDLIFRVHCKFDKGESVFTSNTLNNVKRGRYNTKLNIPKDMRKKYGSLTDYSASIYKNGILLDTKEFY